MDSNLFIDTQSATSRDLRPIGFSLTHYGCLSTIRQLLENDFLDMCRRAQEHHNAWRYAWETKRANFRARSALNMCAGNRSQHRVNLKPNTTKGIKRILSELSAAFQADDSDEVCSLLNDLSNYDRSFATHTYRKLIDIKDLDIYQCSDCSAFGIEDFGTNSEGELVCESCLENSYTYSECMDTYINSNDTCSVYNSLRAWSNGYSDDYCTQRYGDRNFHEYDGGFFSDDDDYYEARRENGEDDDDDDDDPRERRINYLAGWHGTSRNFIDKNVSKKYPSLGAELEVYIPERDEFVGATRTEFGSELILESDGSLCDTHGIEMITHPLGREEWTAFAPRWLTHTQDHNGIGYNEPAGDRYGIHLTIHRDNLSPLAEARIAMFLSSTDNGDFIRAVAQRDQIYNPQSGIGIGQLTRPRVTSISQTIEPHFNLRRGNSENKIMGRGKFCPVNFKGDLAEFRIFQSTTNIDSFKKNLEFVWALWAWTKPETASGNSHSHKDFVTWLNKRQQRKEFPALIKFLSKRMFYGTNFTPLISPWHSLMTKPTEDSAIESMAA